MVETAFIDSRGSARALALSMRSVERRLEAVASNLANVSTAGHKRVLGSFQSFDNQLTQAKDGLENIGNIERRDFSQGRLTGTENLRQLALEGDGFIAVQEGNSVAYRRNVTLHQDSGGYLTDQTGRRVMGTAGPIQLADDLATAEVEEFGEIRQHGASVGQIRVVEFDDPGRFLEAGPGLYQPRENMNPKPATGTRVLAGFTEGSNVDPLKEMVHLITIQRHFQASERALLTESNMRDRLIQSL